MPWATAPLAQTQNAAPRGDVAVAPPAKFAAEAASKARYDVGRLEESIASLDLVRFDFEAGTLRCTVSDARSGSGIGAGTVDTDGVTIVGIGVVSTFSGASVSPAAHGGGLLGALTAALTGGSSITSERRCRRMMG